MAKKITTMQITVQLPEDSIDALSQRSPPTARSQAFLKIIGDFGLEAEPMHPDTTDPSLRSYLTIKVQNPATAQLVIDQLQQSGAVDAAYSKPSDELP